MRPERFLILLCFAVFAVSGTAVASTGFQGGATHDGNVADSGLRPPLKRAWHRDLGASPAFPIVAGGRVFVLANGMLYALDRATGRTLWRRAVASAPDKLAYDGGRLYVISGRYIAHAIDPATGEALWTVRVAESDMFAGDIVATGGRLYALDDGYGTYLSAFDGATGTRAFRVAAGNTYDAPAVDAARAYVGDGRVEYAHALADGKRLWTSQGDTYGAGEGTAAVHDGRLWTSRGQVLDAATGAKLRDYRSSQIPAFGDGLALLADAGALVAVDEATGAQRWVLPVDGGVVSPPLVVGGTVFAVAGSGRLVSADLATGATLGAIRLDELWLGPERTASYGLAVGEGTLVVPVRGGVSAYVAESATPGTGLPAQPLPPFVADTAPGPDDDARAYQQNAAHSGFLPTGGPVAPLRTRWSKALLRPQRALIADGKVFTVTPHTDSVFHLHALDTADGEPLWRADLPQDDGWWPDIDIAYDAGRVFAVSGDRLRAFDAGTGALLWTTAGRVLTGPIAFGGLVYVGAAGKLQAFREVDGVLAWSVSSGESPGPPASDGRSVWSGQLCGGWDGFDLATLSRIHRSPGCSGGGTGDPVAIAGGLVAHPEGKVVFRADSPDATIVDGLGAKVVPALAHGLRYGVDNGVITAAPATGGPLRWRFAGDGLAYAPPLVVGRQVFVFSSSGWLYALDADSGTRLWSVRTLEQRFAEQTLAAGEGLLVVPTRKRLVAYESAGGAPGNEDTVAPETRLTPIGGVEARDPLVSFAADQDAFFSCKVDTGQWQPCTSPHRLIELTDGTHTFSVRATDVYGNVDETPASEDFTVDAAPDTRLSGPPADTNNTQPSLHPTSPDDRFASFECRFDGGPWFACTGYQPPAPLADGTHRFEARAIDAAGHVDPTPASLEWRQDTVAPTGLSITSVVANTSKPRLAGVASREPDATASVGVFFFRGASETSDDASVSTTVAADGTWSGQAKFAMADGEWRVEARQGDRAGNKVVVTRTIIVQAGEITAVRAGGESDEVPRGAAAQDDAVAAPELALLEPTDDLETPTSPARITGTAPEARPVSVYVRGAASLNLTAMPGPDGAWAVDLPALAPGHYELSAFQKDAAGIEGQAMPHDLYVGVSRTPSPTPGTPGPPPGPVPTWEPPVSPAPTATPSATPTATATPTASPTATRTATTSPLPTATATPTATPAPLVVPARKISATPRQLANEIRAGIKPGTALPLRLSYDAARAGTLVIRLRDAKSKRLVGSARATFRKAGVRTLTVRGRKLPRRVAVEVRFGGLAVVLKG